jgi:ribonuclease HI
MIDENALNIYTDGSSKPKPRRGGIGIRYIYTDMSGKEVCENLPLPGYLGATNNEMELNACIIALKHVSSYLSKKVFQRIIIFTDSNYVVENNSTALFEWPKTKWIRRSGAPVLNAKLWQELNRARKKIRIWVDIKKVEGHSQDIHNREVDRLAKQSANDARNRPLSVRIVRRKKSKEITRVGSVGIIEQRITVRIIEGQCLEVQKLYRYRYEVMSKKSPYYKKVDFIVSTEVLHEGHTYSVKLNNEQDNPRIVKVYREVETNAKPKEISRLIS